MMFYTTAINSVFAFLIAGGILFTRGGVTNELLLNLIFYIVITPVIGTTLTKIMFMSEDAMIVGDAINRINEVLNEKPLSESTVNNTPKDNGITLEHVSYSYDGEKNALNDVSLRVAPGQVIALVGASGGGKTTLCNLIPRFYDVTGGKILIDGQDVRGVTLHSLRGAIGVVQQDVYLFSGTVAQNIAYGKPGATRQEIEAAARLAGAEKFILALKDGYDTYVGERGVKLSGGQKQRLAIARVFLKNPRILLLDEATSALDNESEILVGQSLDKLAKGRTTLTIAHRLTTIKNADRILVLGRDGIEEEGSHDELLAKHGVYYRLWNGLVSGETL